MKKILAVLMSVLVVFTTCFITVFADEAVDESSPTVVKEESTTRDIMTDDGLVVPINFTQLKSSVIFKIFEKIIKFILSLFGAETGPEVDNEGATLVDEVASALDERLTDLFA